MRLCVNDGREFGGPTREAESAGARGDRCVVASGELSLGRADLSADNPLLRVPLAPETCQAATARPLGHHAGAEFRLRPHEPGDRRREPERHLRDRAGARRAGARGQRLPRRHLQRGVSTHRPRRGGPSPVVPAVFVSGWDPQPRSARDAGIDSRGWGAGVLPAPCLRGGVRQPGSVGRMRDRGRRGRDREHLPPAGTRTSSSTRRAMVRCFRSFTSTATRSPTPRFWPGSTATSSARCSRASATTRASSRGPSLGRCMSSWPRPSMRRLRHRGDPGPSAVHRGRHSTALADDRALHAEGLDGAQAGRRTTRRGVVSLPPGPAGSGADQSRSSEGPRCVAALVPSGRAVRRARRAPGRDRRARSHRSAAYEREPQRQRRPAPARTRAARFP